VALRQLLEEAVTTASILLTRCSGGCYGFRGSGSKPGAAIMVCAMARTNPLMALAWGFVCGGLFSRAGHDSVTSVEFSEALIEGNGTRYGNAGGCAGAPTEGQGGHMRPTGARGNMRVDVCRGVFPYDLDLCGRTSIQWGKS
jgi:hypothetical protein